MKRIIVLLIWLSVFYLLGVFIYQKTTGNKVDGIVIRNWIDRIATSAQYKVQSFSSGFKTPRTQTGNEQATITQTGSITVTQTISNTIAVEAISDAVIITGEQFARVKTGLQRNQDFTEKLLSSSLNTQTNVGKGMMFASRSGSADHRNDQIIITLSGETTSYPAMYTQDNINSTDFYSSDGIIAIEADAYYIYYEAKNSQGMTRGYLMNASNGSTMMIDNLMPLLFYKNQYYFASPAGDHYQELYKIQSGGLVSLSKDNFKSITVENDYISIHNIGSGTIQVFSIYNNTPLITLPLHRSDISYQAFLMQSGAIWIKYKDNQKGTIIYENYKQ